MPIKHPKITIEQVLMTEDYTIADNPKYPALELTKGKIEDLPPHIAKIVVEEAKRGKYYTPPPPEVPEDIDMEIDDELPPVKKEPGVITANDVGNLAQVLGVSPAALDKAKADKGNGKKKGKKK